MSLPIVVTGSKADSESVRPGSNPGSATNQGREQVSIDGIDPASTHAAEPYPR